MANMTSDLLGKANGSEEDQKIKSQVVENQFENLTFKTGEAVVPSTLSLVESAIDRAKKSRAFIIEHPIAGIALAAAVGLVAGRLLAAAVPRQK